MLDYYFDESRNGRRMLRPETHDRFFADLHETMHSQIFEGLDLLYESAEEGSVEVRLPAAEELISHVRMRVTENGILIAATFPSTTIPEGEERPYFMEFLYNPPSAGD